MVQGHNLFAIAGFGLDNMRCASGLFGVP